MSTAFRYRAATAGGQLVEGVVRADSERSALEDLRRQTLVPVSLAPEQVSPSRPVWPRASPRSEVAVAMRTMATLLAGGATLDQVLDFAARQAAHPDVSTALDGVRRDVHGGLTLATALGQRAALFGTLAPALVRAGEESGSLDAALDRLANHQERAQALRAQLRDALIYPALLALVAGVGVTVLLTFVVPRFVQMLGDLGGNLPWSTRLLVGASRGATDYAWLWIGGIGALVAGAIVWNRDAEHRAQWHAARLTWPVVGALEWTAATARFARTLAALLAGGTPVLTALRIARESVDNLYMGRQLDAAIARVERGDRLATALDGVLPPLPRQLLAVGEESGTLGAMAERAADGCDAEVQRGLRRLVGLVEPVLIVLFGGLVGFIALAMLQAIYSINASVP
ncbi:MAG: type II secretion system F family protein [Gemmatimonadaceae bacterium]|nr:type II secretion system F family protein [Gemmatimonadaceae bacterium]